MKILSAEQIRSLDALTIEQEPVRSIDLMERAAMGCVKRILKLVKPSERIAVICGMGNNGGDGLAIARILSAQGVSCQALVIRYAEKLSDDANENYSRLKEKYPDRLKDIHNIEELAEALDSDSYRNSRVIVDALFGTGLNKPVTGLAGDTIQYINKNFSRIISIDLPSGLYADRNSAENKNIIFSSLTLTFQLPKLALLLPENEKYAPEFEILDIGLSQTALETFKNNQFYITKDKISSLLKKRNKFSHKGTFGHALLLAGSRGKSGAAIICAKACLRSGAGLLTVHSDKDTLAALLQHLPEAMSVEDQHPEMITEIDKPEKYTALAIGPGVGTEPDTQLVLKKLLHYYGGKLVIDADGLNILSENKTWLSFLLPDTILTPHPKEFERLTEKHADDFERCAALKQFSIKHNCIVVLKGAHSIVAMPDGNLFFNSSGNAGLAKGGTGDGLTGIILGLLSRGYNAPQAALVGTYIHGYAADLFAKKKSMESMLVSDLIELLPKAFKKLEEFNG